MIDFKNYNIDDRNLVQNFKNNPRNKILLAGLIFCCAIVVYLVVALVT